MMSFRSGYLEKQPWSHHVIRLIGRIREYKGKQELFERQTPQILSDLRQTAMIQSTESSNRIEGIVVSAGRIKSLVTGHAEPQSRPEAEVTGYRNVLDTIHSSHGYIRLSPNTILQLHRDLMKLATGKGGNWKNTDNTIEEVLPDGERRIRFKPVPSWKTSEAVQELVQRFNLEIERGEIEELILIAAFVLDFLSIHPFADGNGRMARLLTLLLLYQSGYRVGRYVSLETVIESSKEQYYDTLYRSSQGWHAGEHRLFPWLEYFLTVTLQSYMTFEERVGTIRAGSRGWKGKQVEQVISSMSGEFTIADLEERCPGIGRPTLSRVLNKLKKEGQLLSIGGGRTARWRKA